MKKLDESIFLPRIYQQNIKNNNPFWGPKKGVGHVHHSAPFSPKY